MGKLILENVMDALRKKGIRVQRAYPGDRMPAIESMVAAVQLEQIDQAAATATVLVSVLAPAAMGAAESEDGAVLVSRILQTAGAMCRIHKTEHMSSANLFCTRVSAVFSGQETENGWQAAPKPLTFSVMLGSTVLNCPVSFTAERAVDETAAALANAQWRFELEELFPLNVRENSTPASPYTITVRRDGRTEVYSGCVVTYQKRILGNDGQRQIRRGTATGRTVS